MWDWQGLMDSNHRVTESESVALPLGEAPIKKALHWSAVQILSAEGLYRMAGVDGIKPPSAELQSDVRCSLTELNSCGGTNGYRTHDLLRDKQAF